MIRSEPVSDPEQDEIDRLTKALRDLVEESRRLAKRHEEITQEFNRLRQALEQAQSRRFGKVN
jgi:HAMP domain-containing protein